MTSFHSMRSSRIHLPVEELWLLPNQDGRHLSLEFCAVTCYVFAAQVLQATAPMLRPFACPRRSWCKPYPYRGVQPVLYLTRLTLSR